MNPLRTLDDQADAGRQQLRPPDRLAARSRAGLRVVRRGAVRAAAAGRRPRDAPPQRPCPRGSGLGLPGSAARRGGQPAGGSPLRRGQAVRRPPRAAAPGRPDEGLLLPLRPRRHGRGGAAGLLLFSRSLGLVAAAAAVLMAFSRVYVAAHYPWDVLAGLALGALVAVVGWLLLRRLLVALVAWLRGRPGLRAVFAPEPSRERQAVRVALADPGAATGPTWARRRPRRATVPPRRSPGTRMSSSAPPSGRGAGHQPATAGRHHTADQSRARVRSGTARPSGSRASGWSVPLIASTCAGLRPAPESATPTVTRSRSRGRSVG